MAWATPIIDWLASNVLTKDDFNRIEGNTKHLYDNKVDKVGSVVSVATRTGDVILTKDDVGLDEVENYGIASTLEALAGTSNIKNMTPLRVKEVIDAFGIGFVVGTYTGDNAATRTFNLGFTPKAVLVMAKGSAVYNYNSEMDGGLAVTGSPARNRGNNSNALGLEIVANGFKVYNTTADDVFINSSSEYYNYIALR